MPEDERFASWHLVEADGRVVSRGAVVERLLDQLGHPTATRGARQASSSIERLYDLVARHRATLGRLVPDVSAPRRFP